MQAFCQACRQCPDPWLEEPRFSQETMERLLHNLVLKILNFYRLPIQPSDLLEVRVDAPVVGLRLQRVEAGLGVGCLGALDGCR